MNVCIYRIPNEESIAFPPSHCMKCGYRLQPMDLVPVFSYVFLKGKCRSCGDKISIQYPAIELLNGIMYLLIYLKYGYTLDSLKFMILVSFIIVIGMIDYKTKFVYTCTTLTGVIIGFVFFIIESIIKGKINTDSLIGLAISGIFIGLIVFLTHGMGEGDIEIAAMCGIFLGIKGTVFMLFSAIVIGGIAGAIALVLKKKGRKYEMPFGPFLAIGTILAIFIGVELINMYLEYVIIL